MEESGAKNTALSAATLPGMLLHIDGNHHQFFLCLATLLLVVSYGDTLDSPCALRHFTISAMRSLKHDRVGKHFDGKEAENP